MKKSLIMMTSVCPGASKL
jgi:hypothetical protein